MVLSSRNWAYKPENLIAKDNMHQQPHTFYGHTPLGDTMGGLIGGEHR